MNNDLITNYDKVMEYCMNLFQNKNADYGPVWLLYRFPSLNDEIWRKAKRIRTLEEHDDHAIIPEGRDVEYVGIINYCIMFLIKLGHNNNLITCNDFTENLESIESIKSEDILNAYRTISGEVRDLLIKKNTDYGDAWKSMSPEAMTDQIIIRVYRIRTILSNHGKCRVSEGIASQLFDIINYCIFALIKMKTPLIPMI